MEINLKEKLAICHTCCGPTYRESALDKLQNYYFDNDNIYYCVLTDDKKYFDGLNRKNLIVNELKDFYCLYPKLEKNEFFLESTDKNDYSKKFVSTNYTFPFSTYRFNILQSIKLGIKNVALMPTDGTIDFNNFNDSIFDNKNFIYNAHTEWMVETSQEHMHLIVDRIKDKFNLNVDQTVMVLDAAARVFIPDTLTRLIRFFIVWNDIIEYVYDNNLMRLFAGQYARNDEYIIAPVYNAVGLSQYRTGLNYRIFDIRHDVKKERYWRTCGSEGLLEHPIYEEFLKINEEKLNKLK